MAGLSFADYREICEVKARYFRAVDTHDWPLLDAVFTAETQFRGYGFGVRKGVDDLRDALRSNFAQVQSQHQGFNPEMSVRTRNADGHAVIVHTRWAFHDALHWPVLFTALNIASVPDQLGLTGTGFYEDEVTLSAAGWRITATTHYRTRLEALTTSGAVLVPVPQRPLDPDWV